MSLNLTPLNTLDYVIWNVDDSLRITVSRIIIGFPFAPIFEIRKKGGIRRTLLVISIKQKTNHEQIDWYFINEVKIKNMMWKGISLLCAIRFTSVAVHDLITMQCYSVCSKCLLLSIYPTSVLINFHLKHIQTKWHVMNIIDEVISMYLQ